MGLDDMFEEGQRDSSSKNGSSSSSSSDYDPLDPEEVEKRKPYSRGNSSGIKHKVVEAVEEDGLLRSDYTLYRSVTEHITIQNGTVLGDDREEIVNVDGEDYQILTKELSVKLDQDSFKAKVFEIRVKN